MKRILIILALLISTVYGQSKAGFYVVGGKIITVQDTSSRKYLKAIENAGVVPSIIQNFASNYLVSTEKSIGTYTLMKAQYPFIGGTAATHKFNMNNPVDTDAGFRLVYTGTITHDANGILFNGTNGFANTKLNPTVALTNPKTSIALSAYITGGTGLGASFPTTMGAHGNNNTDLGNYESTLYHRASSAFYIAAGENFPSNYAGGSFTFSNGYLLGNSSSTKVQLYKLGLKIAESTISASGFAANGNIFLGAVSINTSTPEPLSYQNVRLGYSHVSTGLTDDQAAKQSIIVKNFNSILSR